MTLLDFIKNNEVDYSYNRASETLLCEIEVKIGTTFGKQLRQYILDYGYLGYKHVELFGVNAFQGLDSDMVTKTKRLNERFPKTKGMLAIEDQGDGDYYLVDSKDSVYRFVAANNELVSQNMDLFEYIVQRFLNA